jgi:hypothetical protein
VDPVGRIASVGAARLTKAGAKGGVFAFAPTVICSYLCIKMYLDHNLAFK